MKKLPEGWKLVTLGDICTINMGQSPKSETYNENSIGFPLIQGNADIKHRKTLPRIYTSELTKECNIGDIIMTVRAPVGSIAKSYHNACIGRGVCSIQAIEEKEFLYQFLLNYENKWDKLSQGSTFTAVNGSDIKNIKIPLPPLEEQKKIAEILSTVDQKIAFVDNQIEETEALKKGLMQKLLTEGIGHSEFKDSELGRIPVEWEVIKFKDCAKISVGIATSTTEHFVDKGTPLIRNQNIKENKFDFSDLLFISEKFAKENKTKKIKEHDLLVIRTGYPGLTAVVTKEMEGWQTFTTLIVRPNGSALYSHFIAYYMNSPFGKNNLAKLEAGGAQKNLNSKSLEKFKLILPPLEEQKQIAEILSAADEKLENLKAKKESFEELKKGLMQKLLTGEVRV